MEQLLRGLLSQMNGDAAALGAKPKDSITYPDTSETVKISALALLKMLKHARSGVPLEVMGLMLGEFVDEFTITVVDVFAMPQSGTSVSVESVDPAYQAKMLDMLGRTGRKEMVVGWYHSHPGFGCWLSSVDQNTQQSFETLHRRAVAVVIDPVQSVKGKVILEAFRLVQPSQFMSLSSFTPIRQQTSCIGSNTGGPAISVLHGLGKKYYALVCEYMLNEREQQMLLKLNAQTWMDGFRMLTIKNSEKAKDEAMDAMIKLAAHFSKDIADDSHYVVPEEKKKKEKGVVVKNEKEVRTFGRLNAKQRLEQVAEKSMQGNVLEQLTSSACFQAMQRSDFAKPTPSAKGALRMTKTTPSKSLPPRVKSPLRLKE